MALQKCCHTFKLNFYPPFLLQYFFFPEKNSMIMGCFVFLLSCQCELFILPCLRVSDYISRISPEKLTKLAFRHPPTVMALCFFVSHACEV